MTCDYAELLCDEFALNGDLLALFSDKIQLLEQWFQSLLEPVDGFHCATDIHRHDDHRDGDREKRNGDDYHYPKGRVIGIHLKGNRRHKLLTGTPSLT